MAFAGLPNKLNYVQYQQSSVETKSRFVLRRYGFSVKPGSDYMNGIHQLLLSSNYFSSMVNTVKKEDAIGEWFRFMGKWLLDRDLFVEQYKMFKLDLMKKWIYCRNWDEMIVQLQIGAKWNHLMY